MNSPESQNGTVGASAMRYTTAAARNTNVAMIGVARRFESIRKIPPSDELRPAARGGARETSRLPAG